MVTMRVRFSAPILDHESMLKPSPFFRAAEGWSKTLRLPRSTFPPRALASEKAALLKQCTDDLYAWQAAQRPAKDQFVLHDGPPYANGGLHIGHALNKISKDIICRFQLSQGRRVHYIPGWDCHGLPIEIKALQSKQHHTEMAPTDIRTAARKLATDTIAQQKESFKAWAVMGDWENAYRTMEPGFEMRQLNVFKKMVGQGLIYRQYKPVHWSPSSGTALAEAELEYDDNHKSLAAYIKFPIVYLPERLNRLIGTRKLFALIWTTTPWTLPANKAIAVHKELEYSILQTKGNGDLMVVATSRISDIVGRAGLNEHKFEVFETGLTGHDLEGAQYINVLQGPGAKTQPIVHADFVSASSGSGLVHMAPGHGHDDYKVCQSLGIAAFTPVDDRGLFTEAAYSAEPQRLLGTAVLEGGSKAVLEILEQLSESQNSKLVWATHLYEHKYPIDWRTKQPVIVRATAQWFADVESIKPQALAALENTHFIPDTGKSRLASFIAGRSQWCISRQRAWGVPIPALYDVDSGREVMTTDSIEHIINVIKDRGIDAWWTDEPHDPHWVKPGLEGSFIRGKDTMDVWFDSGSSWSLLEERDGPPADVYIEGTDQHRGWFQSSLLTYLASRTGSDCDANSARAPYRTLITHGFALDQHGRKMSKSLGNVVSPQEITDGTLLPPVKPRKKQGASKTHSYDAMGADALRLWVASSDYTRDVVIGQPVLQAVNTSLHKLRVTFKWLLGVLSDYDMAAAEQVKSQPPRPADHIALHQLGRTTETAHAAYTDHEPFKAVNAIMRYVNISLSAFYVECVKDTLYADALAPRRAAQATCFEILSQLLYMLAPVAPLTVAEVLHHASPSLREHLADPFRSVWTPLNHRVSELLDQQTSWITAAHDAVKRAQEKVRGEGKMGSSLDCEVILLMPGTVLPATRTFFTDAMHDEGLAGMFVVSKVHIVGDESKMRAELAQRDLAWSQEESFELPAEKDGGAIATAVVVPPQLAKCPRCWRYAAEPPSTELDSSLDRLASLCGRCEDVLKESAV